MIRREFTVMKVEAVEYGDTVWAVRNKARQTARWLEQELTLDGSSQTIDWDIDIEAVAENWDGWPTRWKATVCVTSVERLVL